MMKHGSRVQIGSLLDTRLLMSRSVGAEIQEDNGQYAAWCEELKEFGVGPDPTSALEDLRTSIADLFHALKERQDRLGPDLQETWQTISGIVSEA